MQRSRLQSRELSFFHCVIAYASLLLIISSELPHLFSHVFQNAYGVQLCFQVSRTVCRRNAKCHIVCSFSLFHLCHGCVDRLTPPTDGPPWRVLAGNSWPEKRKPEVILCMASRAGARHDKKSFACKTRPVLFRVFGFRLPRSGSRSAGITSRFLASQPWPASHGQP